MVVFDFLEIKHVLGCIGSSSIGVNLGLEPISVSRQVKRPEGEIEQGSSIGSENSVYHRHYSGTLRLYPIPSFRYTEGATIPWLSYTYPPNLRCKPTESSTEFIVGNFLIPHTGELKLWYNPSNNSWFGGIWEGYRVRFLLANSYVETWYSADFTHYTQYSTIVNYCNDETSARNIFARAPRIGNAVDPCTSPPYPVSHHAINLVGDDPSSVMNYVLPDCPIKGKYPYLPNDKELWWDLTCNAVDTMDALDINSIAFLKELGEWRKLLPPVPTSVSSLLSKKTWASFYLWLRYGLSLTISDSKKIINSLPKLKRTFKAALNTKKRRVRTRTEVTVNSNGQDWVCTVGLRVLLDTFPENFRSFGTFIDGLHSLDLYPTTANLWDLIPLSFVVDWFIPVQRWLESIDTSLRTLNFVIYCVTKSMKWSRSVPPPYVPGYTTSDQLSEVHYIRAVGTVLPAPIMSFSNRSQPVSETTIFKRIADGVALLIQRRS